MPVRRHRRCGRRMACCMALRRPCINSLPRYYMPQHPLFQSHPAHPAAPSSSQSDCSCGEEKFCTVENCRNAPMCLSTRPLYCPYGSYQTDGVNLPTSSGQHGTDAAAANYPRGPLNDRVASPSPFYTHNTPPLFPPDYGRTEGGYQNGWVYERELPSSFWERSRHNFQRPSPTRLSNAMPQFITSSPGSRNAGRFEPQISSLHRTQQPDIPHTRSRADNILPPSTHLTATESVTGEREIVTHQNLLNFDQSHDQRDYGRPSLKDAYYRRFYSTGGGTCGVERSCSKNHATHNNAPHTCDGTGGCLLPNGQGPTTDCLKNTSHQQAMDQPGVVSCPVLDLQTMGVPQTHLAPDPCTSATKISETNESKCPCRYPPSFKHLSCTGNISGSCSCGQK